jgi:DNA/RNA-binding domain of Phe-tRNA-synthetase-like protein
VPLFAYDPAVREQYPAVRAAVIHAVGLANSTSPPALAEAYAGEQRAAAERLRATPIADLPSIAAWRRAFTRFGAKPTQYRNAAEALLRRLDKQGAIPSLGCLVDIGNLVSIRYALPVAVFDLAGVAAPLTVRIATGAERFTDLGADEAVHPEPGEVVFVDAAGVVAARRWCWRQSAQSATRPATAEALFVVEGQHAAARADADAAARDLQGLLAAHQSAAQVTAAAL